jgi:endonuclease-3 related protein
MTSSAIAPSVPAEPLNHAPGKAAALSPHLTQSRHEARPSRDAEPPLDEYFNSMFTALGPQHWWPGNSRFEIILGAILTQNTSWNNVEGALTKLRAAGLFSPAAIEKVPLRQLQRLIRSSGYYRQKARKLKAFCEFLRRECAGSLKRMFETPTILLREKLLAIFGIGPETADSILLYAGEHSVFPVDAYTRRLLLRHGWIDEKTKYEDIRWMFERQFAGDTRRFNEFHALIVANGKKFCRVQQPLCDQCSLGRYLEEGR